MAPLQHGLRTRRAALVARVARRTARALRAACNIPRLIVSARSERAASHRAEPAPRRTLFSPILTSPPAPRPPTPAEFGEFVRVLTKQKEKVIADNDETDLVDAFMACGGNADKSGCVERSTLVRIIKVDFGLQIDIEELIDAIDADGSGEIEFGEFKELLTSK